MTIVEFLKARLDDDEAVVAQAAAHASSADTPGCEWFANIADSNGDSIVAMYPARGMAEVAAKREIIRRSGLYARDLLGLLASVYSDHPDYRQEWKP